jgi:hypothetical protein
MFHTRLIETVASYYFKGTQELPPRTITVMLNMLLRQLRLPSADKVVEENIYDRYAIKQFIELVLERRRFLLPSYNHALRGQIFHGKAI